MGLGSGNTPGAWLLKVKNQLKEIAVRVVSMEKTLGGSEKIPGISAPTAQVAAKVGQIYIDVTTGEEWKCVAVNGNSTSWEKQTKSSVGLTAADVGAVPNTRKVNKKALNADITLTAADVGASPEGHKHNRSEITDFPTSMPASDVAAWAKAAGKPTYTASEVGAAEEDHGHGAEEIALSAATAAALGLSGNATVAEALAAVSSSAAGSVRIATGSYTGTGTCGQSAPNSLSFDFAPDVVFVFTDEYVPMDMSNSYVAFSASYVCFLRGGQTVTVRDLYRTIGIGQPGNVVSTTGHMPYTMGEAGLSWYYNGSNIEDIGPSSQMNGSGTVYHYLAIGREAAG